MLAAQPDDDLVADPLGVALPAERASLVYTPANRSTEEYPRWPLTATSAIQAALKSVIGVSVSSEAIASSAGVVASAGPGCKPGPVRRRLLAVVALRERGDEEPRRGDRQGRRKHEPSVIAALRSAYGPFYLLPEGGSNGPAVLGCA